jgi:hypothetical protein
VWLNGSPLALKGRMSQPNVGAVLPWCFLCTFATVDLVLAKALSNMLEFKAMGMVVQLVLFKLQKAQRHTTASLLSDLAVVIVMRVIKVGTWWRRKRWCAHYVLPLPITPRACSHILLGLTCRSHSTVSRWSCVAMPLLEEQQ